MTKVSVIIPCYNSEHYVSKCIDSVLKQSLSDIEVIVVDDGSADHTHQILQEYQKQDSRVIVIHQSNQGLSSARNAGMKVAHGKYIGFVDSDDWIHEDMYLELYKASEKFSADIAISTFFEVYQDCIMPTYEHLPEGLTRWDMLECRESVIMRFLSNDYLRLQGSAKSKPPFWRGYVWNRLYKAEFLQQKQITFPSELKGFWEDLIFSFQVILCSDTVACLDRPLYYYQCNRPGSLASCMKLSGENFFTELEPASKMIESLFSGKEAFVDACRQAFNLHKASFFVESQLEQLSSCKKENRHCLIVEISERLKHDCLRKLLRNTHIKNMKSCFMRNYLLLCKMGWINLLILYVLVRNYTNSILHKEIRTGA